MSLTTVILLKFHLYFVSDVVYINNRNIITDHTYNTE